MRALFRPRPQIGWRVHSSAKAQVAPLSSTAAFARRPPQAKLLEPPRCCATAAAAPSSAATSAAELRALATRILAEHSLADRLVAGPGASALLGEAYRLDMIAAAALAGKGDGLTAAEGSLDGAAADIRGRLIRDSPPPTARQLRIYFAQNCIPFIGFGFFDNAIMLIAGDYLDAKLGVAFGLTTLAAAAIGNTVSDVIGLWISGFIETAGAAMGLPESGMTLEQQNDIRARILKNWSMIVGIVVGCILGMFPLLYPDEWRLWESREQKAAHVNLAEHILAEPC